MAAPANRPKLQSAIRIGYVVPLGLAILAAGVAASDLSQWKWAFATLIVAKLATNSLAWFALWKDSGVLATQALNTASDVVLLTAAIYFTGGANSPLLATYVIVVAAHSLLSNLGITIVMA